MKKSVYSLVLMDEVVDEIDRLAYQKNTNRSNLINQMLAERLGFVTPEMKMKDIFSQLEEMLSESCYQILDRTTDCSFSVRSPIRYKYRPSVKYQIELFREPRDIVGRLKVSFRTSSKTFTDAVEDFFVRWMHMEAQYLSSVHKKGIPASLDNAKYTRGFLGVRDTPSLSEVDIGTSIGEYLKVLDTSIKFYFEHMEEEEVAERQMKEAYQNYLSSGVYIV